jgi:hypothetical protein
LAHSRGGEAAQGVGTGLPEVGDGPRGVGAQQGLEARAGGLDRLSDAMDLMGWQIDGVDAPSRHRCLKVVSLIITRTEAFMSEVSTVRLDLAKNVFQVHGANASGAVVFARSFGAIGCSNFLPGSRLVEE